MTEVQYFHGQTHKSQSFFSSAKHAWRGLKIASRWEANFKRQLALLAVALVAAAVLRVGILETILLLMVAALVLALELSNSALEALADVVQPDYHKDIQRAKDMMAGAVLVVSIIAFVIGLLIFMPPLWRVVG